MAKIFGISGLPVSTFMSPFEQPSVPAPTVRYIARTAFVQKPDVVILNNQPKRVNSAKYNAAGRFVKQFSKKPIVK